MTRSSSWPLPTIFSSITIEILVSDGS